MTDQRWKQRPPGSNWGDRQLSALVADNYAVEGVVIDQLPGTQGSPLTPVATV